jgi:hypothetical protein
MPCFKEIKKGIKPSQKIAINKGFKGSPPLDSISWIQMEPLNLPPTIVEH